MATIIQGLLGLRRHAEEAKRIGEKAVKAADKLNTAIDTLIEEHPEDPMAHMVHRELDRKHDRRRGRKH